MPLCGTSPLRLRQKRTSPTNTSKRRLKHKENKLDSMSPSVENGESLWRPHAALRPLLFEEPPPETRVALWMLLPRRTNYLTLRDTSSSHLSQRTGRLGTGQVGSCQTKEGVVKWVTREPLLSTESRAFPSNVFVPPCKSAQGGKGHVIGRVA